ncbi:MAG: sulfotransferase [Prochloraceae cyanobacterium]
MFKIYFTLLNKIWKKFGFSGPFLFWGLLIPLRLSFTHFTLFLDRIFFPGYRKKKIVNPVFIIGCPRSGTTFLHTLLTETRDFSVFETWQLIFPSLTARALVKPIVNHLVKTNRSTIMDKSKGHEMSLNKIEHDEFLFLHKIEMCGFRFASLLAKEFENGTKIPELDIPDRQPKYLRDKSMDFFKGCLQRQLYYTGKDRLIAHVHFSTLRLKTLLKAFPDAKFIYLVRSPYEVIPSYTSFFTKVGATKQVFFTPKDSLYQEVLQYYRYFYELQQNQEIPPENYTVVRYEDLCSNLEETFAKIVAFTGIKPSQALKESVEQKSKKQKNYRRKHKNLTLEDLGLTKEKIAEDFSFAFEKYGWSEPQAKTEKISVSSEL